MFYFALISIFYLFCFQLIENLATFRYKTLTVPDLRAANVLFANGTLLYQDGFPESAKVCKIAYQREGEKENETSCVERVFCELQGKEVL